jgi:hypothetical protein
MLATLFWKSLHFAKNRFPLFPFLPTGILFARKDKMHLKTFKILDNQKSSNILSDKVYLNRISTANLYLGLLQDRSSQKKNNPKGKLDSFMFEFGSIFNKVFHPDLMFSCLAFKIRYLSW